MTEFTSVEQLQDPVFRKQLIKDIIDNAENVERRAQMLRRHEVYRDRNKKWVMYSIMREGYKKETIERMSSRATNVSIARKVVNKKATTYVGGVERKLGEPTQSADGQVIQNPDQANLDLLVDELDVNTRMKLCDRYRELFRNTLVGCIPVKDERETAEAATDKFRLVVRVLAPWQYDVIPDPCDDTRAAVIIISDFPERARFQVWDEREAMGYRTAESTDVTVDGADLRDNHTIASRPEDKGQDPKKRRFIVWCDKYHFTMDSNGDIIPESSPKDGLNPIGRMPWVNVAQEQEGYWAYGGDDTVDGSVLINKLMTDVNFIAYNQGWGQLVIAARQVPKVLTGGPDKAFVFEKQADEGNVQVEYVSSNPPIAEWLSAIKMQLALLLTTNNLSAGDVSANLDVKNMASGVALIIDSSEMLTDNADVRELFRDKEPELWEIVRLWHTKYHTSTWLVKSQMAIQPIKSADVNTKFLEAKPPISEKDHLTILDERKALGLNTIVELLQKDNPDLSYEEATKRADLLLKDRKQYQELYQSPTTPPGLGVNDGATAAAKTNPKADPFGDGGPASSERA